MLRREAIGDLKKGGVCTSKLIRYLTGKKGGKICCHMMLTLKEEEGKALSTERSKGSGKKKRTKKDFYTVSSHMAFWGGEKKQESDILNSP